MKMLSLFKRINGIESQENDLTSKLYPEADDNMLEYLFLLDQAQYLEEQRKMNELLIKRCKYKH